MRDFELEIHFEKWEFSAKHHMTASDAQSLSLSELLAMGSPEDRAGFDNVWLGYTQTWGSSDLRRAIAQTYDSLSMENILCFAGAEEGVYTAMRVLLDGDDHAIVTVPNYQAAETIPLDICQVSGIALRADNNWRLDMDFVADSIQPNTRLISINFPNNPTGAIIPKDDLRALIDLCRKHDIYLFSDEVYRLLELDENKRIGQIADIYEKGLSLNVMSKAYGLPGLRIGWIASQDTEVLSKMERYKHYLSICNSAPSEYLARIALKVRDTILDKNRTILHHNIGLLEEFFGNYPGLFEWQRPDGGCVAYPRFTGNGGIEALCRDLVNEQGVLLLPASVYHSELLVAETDRFRIGFGRKNMEEGLAAMGDFLDRHHNELGG